MRTKRGDANVRTVFQSTEEDMANYQRTCMVEKWMEKKVTENAVVRRKSVADKYRQDSSSSSSDSSCGGAGGFFSPSETESFPVKIPKPVRTGGSKEKYFGDTRRDFADQSGEKSKNGGGFSRTKSRALKMYGDLKKVKQAPISPGGKLAGFLNTLFTAGNSKKPNKIAASCDDNSPSLKSTKTTSCSSASSFSRSCLVKTPSSGGKSSGGEKRSVKFFPVDNYDSMKSAIDEELLAHIMEKNRRVEEAARDFLMNYQKKIEIGNLGLDQNFIEEEDDDFDAASYASSDLFELENLSAIGMERYKEELPVYETTHLHDNIAIANGFIL
ncbi:hypothetical protein DH2020_013210 [Rehmannia glutinosa]|uniref:Protein BIG GRAIN 1-like B n=1 Tax=Rehmannia glutinosa TaxID=99300 RepID=A0ABR0X459_REHGL